MGRISDHTNLIMDLFAEGLKPWQIALWDKRWHPSYVRSVITKRKKKGDSRGNFRHENKGRPTKMEFMSHHYRYISGVEYQCLRCKRIGEKEEINAIACIAVEDEYKVRVSKNARKSASSK